MALSHTQVVLRPIGSPPSSEGQQHRTVVPTFRANSGAAAIRADFTTQVDEVEHEAGVRMTA